MVCAWCGSKSPMSVTVPLYNDPPHDILSLPGSRLASQMAMGQVSTDEQWGL